MQHPENKNSNCTNLVKNHAMKSFKNNKTVQVNFIIKLFEGLNGCLMKLKG